MNTELGEDGSGFRGLAANRRSRLALAAIRRIVYPGNRAADIVSMAVLAAVENAVETVFK